MVGLAVDIKKNSNQNDRQIHVESSFEEPEPRWKFYVNSPTGLVQSNDKYRILLTPEYAHNKCQSFIIKCDKTPDSMKTLQGNQLDTRCKYKDLKWLADMLLKQYTFILQPAFPSEKGLKHEFELWLMYILQHPILRTSEVSRF